MENDYTSIKKGGTVLQLNLTLIINSITHDCLDWKVCFLLVPLFFSISKWSPFTDTLGWTSVQGTNCSPECNVSQLTCLLHSLPTSSGTSVGVPGGDRVVCVRGVGFRSFPPFQCIWWVLRCPRYEMVFYLGGSPVFFSASSFLLCGVLYSFQFILC